jgi:hypothetical protein
MPENSSAAGPVIEYQFDCSLCGKSAGVVRHERMLED